MTSPLQRAVPQYSRCAIGVTRIRNGVYRNAVARRTGASGVAWENMSLHSDSQPLPRVAAACGSTS